LGDLRAEITVVRPVDPDDRERDMVFDVRCSLRRKKEVWKNSSTALSSKEGEFARSITACAPVTAS
jgi:hypothetical protein